MKPTFLAGLLGSLVMLSACGDDVALGSRPDNVGAAGSGGSAGAGGSASCLADQVSTVEGCLTCSETLEKVGAKKEQATTAANACTVPDDCMLATNDTDCAGACPVAINKGQAQSFAATLTEVSEGYCSDPEYGSLCGYSTPGCAPGEVDCQAGRCVWVQTVPGCGADEVQTDEGCMTCDAVGTRVSQDKANLIDANNDCSGPNDCILVPSDTDCAGACPVAVNQANAPAFGQSLSSLSDAFCTDPAFGSKCGFMTPGCAAGRAECQAGECVWVPDGPPSCQADEVTTAEGCLDCQEVRTAVGNAKQAALAANDACVTPADCTFASADTVCSGDCPVAVSIAGAQAYIDALAGISQAYCSDPTLYTVCGYSTPSCAPTDLDCQGGHCVAVSTQP